MAALLVTATLPGCATPGVLLDPRPLTAPDDPAAAGLAQYNALADRLQATAAYYEEQVHKNHNKLRAMSVLVGVAAGGGGAAIAPLAQPQTPDIARPGIAAVGISALVLAGLFGVLPHAHQYFLKEATYQRHAQQARASYLDVEARCGVRLVGADVDVVAGCVHDLQSALAEARHFDIDSPGKPPREAELDAMIQGAR
jgi:hypothetical protein